MTERKVLNKYYPPDFDPDKLLSRKLFLRTYGGRRGARTMNVRMMMPFSMCCGTCGEFVYTGKKFNSRVEKVQGEDYLGITIWRFYGRCPHCRAEFAFKTDPKNTEYVLEVGGSRLHDPLKDAHIAKQTEQDKLTEEMEEDAMKALEHKTYNAASEILALEQLDELRKINKRLMNPGAATDSALDFLKEQQIQELELSKDDLEELDDATEMIRRREEGGSSDEDPPPPLVEDGAEVPRVPVAGQAGVKVQPEISHQESTQRGGGLRSFNSGLRAKINISSKRAAGIDGVAKRAKVEGHGGPARGAGLLGGYDSD